MRRAIVLSLAGLVATVQGVSGKTKRDACADLDISKRFTSNWGEVTLEQHGCAVVGRYVYADGRIRGALDGNLLRYAWSSNEGSGRGVFVVATNGELVGTWGSGENEIDGGGWNLVPSSANANGAMLAR
jgi:hypothetical protein